MRPAFLLGLMLIFTSACSTPARSPPERSDRLRDLNFDRPLDPATLRSTYSFLSDSEFHLKLGSAHASPLFFFRSFVNTYYSDLAPQWEMGGFGPLGFCLGDPHPENFGFLLFPSGTRYTFNDLDDSGECPIAFDTLRYFTALRLMGVNDEILNESIDHYADVLRAREDAKAIPRDLFPDLEKKREKEINEYVKNSEFVTTAELKPISDRRLQSSILRALESTFQLKDKQVLDIASFIRNKGGSAGLTRYWALVNPNDQPPEILEIKARGRAGVKFGSWRSKDYEHSEIEKLTWQGEKPFWSNSLSIDGKLFAVRTRTKDALNPKKLPGRELRQMIEAQVSLMATLHSQSLQGDIPGLKTWIKSNSAALEARFRQALTASLALMP